MRYLITFSYDGSKYNGYQKQPNKNTIQDNLEEVLTRLNDGKFVSVVASGRTDALVHALNQKAHFDLDIDITTEKVKLALNSMLPKDIYVKNVEVVSNVFHARYNVKRKEYIYKINVGEYNPIEKDYIYQYSKELDVIKMQEAIKYFIGIHNFKSFTTNDDVRDSYERKIYKACVKIKKDIVTISFTGNGFLRYMVRNMVGTLIEVGEGNIKPSDINKILEFKDRTKAYKTAPPEGLYLNNVIY